MTKGVNIPIAADASQVIEAGKKTANALDLVIDSLDNVTDESKTTARDVDTQMGKIEDSAKDASSDLERKFSDSFEKVRKDAKATGDTVEKETSEGTGKAGESVEEFKAEAAANFSEVASSFTGDMSQATDGIQGILGGLAGSLPGVAGIASGILAGVGGAMLASFTKNAELSKQAISDMYADMIESGEDYLSQSYQQEEYWKVLQDDEEQLRKTTALSIARDANKSFEDVALAWSGNADKMNAVVDGLIAHRKVFEAQLEDETNTNDDAARAGIASLNNEIAVMQDRSRVIDETTAQVQEQRKAWEDSDRSVSGAIDRIDSLQQRISDLHGGSFRIDFLDRDDLLRYLTDVETKLKSITGDKSLHIARGLGGGGGQVL